MASKISTITAELSGYVDLGMKRQAMRLAGIILNKESILPDEFSEVVRTVGVMGDFKKWKAKLEDAFNRQSQKFKRKVRSDMFALYASLGEWKCARQFMSDRTSDAADLFFAMGVVLELGKLPKAEALAARCRKALRAASSRFEQSLLLTALGQFFAQMHRWDEAIAVWESMPLEQPFRRDALGGIVRIHLARALESVERGLKLLSELKKNPNIETRLVLPENDEALTREAQKELLKFERGIEKLLPEKAWKDLGIKLG